MPHDFPLILLRIYRIDLDVSTVAYLHANKLTLFVALVGGQLNLISE